MSEPQGSTSSSRLRYAVDETPSVGLTLGLGLQVATVILTGIILIPIIVLNAAGYPEGLEWAVFAALVVKRSRHHPAGPAGGTDRGRLCPLHGHVRCVHRRVGGGGGGGRPVAARDPRGRLVAGTVLLFRAVVGLPPAHHPHGGRHRDHADRRQPVSHHDGHAGGGTPRRRPRFAEPAAGRPSRAFATIVLVSLYAGGARPGCELPSSASWRGPSSRRPVRDAELDAGARRRLGRPAPERLARPGPLVRRAVPGPCSSRSSSSPSSAPSRPTATPSRYNGSRTAPRCRWTSRSSSGR